MQRHFYIVSLDLKENLLWVFGGNCGKWDETEHWCYTRVLSCSLTYLSTVTVFVSNWAFWIIKAVYIWEYSRYIWTYSWTIKKQRKDNCIIYQLYFSFSGLSLLQTVFDPMFISVYNLFYTSLPVLALGIFDQDVSDRYSLCYPKLYTPGHCNLLFNKREFLRSALHGFFTSCVLFLIPYGTLQLPHFISSLTEDFLFLAHLVLRHITQVDQE